MLHGELRVPTALEFLEALGVEPAPDEDGETVESLDLRVDTADRVLFSFDVLGRSVRCRCYRQDVLTLDLFREGATTLTIERGAGTTSLVTRFETGPLTGRLDIQVHPTVVVRDRMLFS